MTISRTVNAMGGDGWMVDRVGWFGDGERWSGDLEMWIRRTIGTAGRAGFLVARISARNYPLFGPLTRGTLDYRTRTWAFH